ncbi:MAG: shikimate kinase [Bacteroidota bacterium]
MLPEKIFLIGMPGSGKSTSGKELANLLNRQYFDLDDVIVNEEGLSISDLFNEKGEQEFRAIERQCLVQSIAQEGPFVMAAGGGTPCFFDNLELMNKNGVTIYLNTPLSVIASRLKNDVSRPLMANHTTEVLYEKRKKWYMQAKKEVRSHEELLAYVTAHLDPS